ncbi:hypothetical protein FB451DRAFT_1013554, partial [Mycena latifolia]
PAFRKMAGILRAATILAFRDFRDWAVHILEAEWSPLLADLSAAPLAHATESVVLARACVKRALYELVR